MASSSNPNLRENNFLKAQLASEAGRHDHAFRFMMEIAESITPWADLTPSERNFLRFSLKKFLEGHRKAWYHINSKTLNWEGVHSELAKFYSKQIADEILTVCRQIKLWITRWFTLSTRSAEAKVFYLTFNGDVSSYFAELVEDKGYEEVAAAIEAYKEAKAMAKAELTWLSPVRLTLALHMSEFYSDVLELPEKGVKIANKALKNAIEAGDKLTEGGFTEEVNELLSKLRDHVATWTYKGKENAEAGTSTSQVQLVAGTSLMTQVASPSETGGKAETSMALMNAIEAGGTLTEGGFMEEINELLSKLSNDFDTSRNYEALKNAIEAGGKLTNGGFMEEINELLSKLSDDFDTSKNYKQENVEAGTSTSWAQLTGTSLMTQVASPSETGEKAETSGTSETRGTPPTESGENPLMALPPPPPPPPPSL